MSVQSSSVYGVGLNDYAGNVSYTDAAGKSVLKPFYVAWTKMLSRGYCPTFQKRCPTYQGCTVAKEWLSLSTFKEWFDKNYVKDFHLDKDLLVQGNKVYGAAYCSYVPQALNKLFLVPTMSTRGLPHGVSVHSKSDKLIAQIRKYNKVKYLGTFPNSPNGVSQASHAYTSAKKEYLAELLQAYAAEISPRIYNHLLRGTL